MQELNARNIDIDGNKYTEYEVSQMQRAMECRVREMKRRVCAVDTMVQESQNDSERKKNQDYFNRESVKLKKAEQKLKDFLNKTGELPDSNRVWVNGFGRSISQKAVHASKKVHKGLTSNNKNGKIKSSNSATSLKDKLSALKTKLKNAVTSDKYKEVSQEYLDSLTKLSKAETMEQSLKSVNPSGRGDNCQRCVPAYEMRRRGYNVIASDPPQNYLDDTIGLYDFRNVFQNAQWIQCNGSGLEEITEFLEKTGNGTRVEISIKTDRGWHLFVGENINGKIIFNDPQMNKSAVNSYFYKNLVESTEFARIDNLEMTNLIKDCLEVEK